jgi:fatty acid desaturase
LSPWRTPGGSWSPAAYLAVVFTQLAFVGHDAGHRQIFRSRRANNLVGLVHANLLVGISFGWWVAKHDRHHSNPNHEDLDPDIDIPALAFTTGQARDRQGLARVVARYQAFLFFPLLLLEAAQLHLASAKAIVRDTGRATVVEALLLLLHFVGYLTALLLVLSPLQAAVFVLVQQGLFGLYLGCSFAPNHKGMPTCWSGSASAGGWPSTTATTATPTTRTWIPTSTSRPWRSPPDRPATSGA